MPNKRGWEDVLGTYNLRNGEFSVYKTLEQFPPISQMGTLAHENAHAADPHIDANARLYGSKENMLVTREHVAAIAHQTDMTHKFLNGYHKHLYNQWKSGEITEAVFLMETHSIMVELRYSNPAHLEEVEDAQFKALDRQGKKNEFVGIMDGVNQTVLNLVQRNNPHVRDVRALNRHIDSLRSDLIHQTKAWANTPERRRMLHHVQQNA